MALSENDRSSVYIPLARLDIREFAGMFRRRAAIIIASVIVCACLGASYVALVPPKYAAFGRILLDPQGLQIVGTGVEQRGARDTSAIEAESQVYVLTSRSVFDRVIAREKLETSPLFGARPRGILTGLLVGLGMARSVDPHAMALRQLERAVSITRSTGSFVINVNVVTEDAQVSTRVADAIMECYVDEQNLAQAETARRAGSALVTRLETLQSHVREAEQRYEKYRSEHGIVVANGQPVLDKQISDLSGQISTAEARVNELRSALNQIEGVKKGTLDLDAIPEAFRGGAIEALKNKYAVAKQAEVNIGATLGPRHPDRVTAAQQTAEARRQLDQAILDIIQSTTVDLNRAEAVVSGLKANLEKAKTDLSGMNEASVRLRELGRDVEANRSIYEAFLVRSRELGEQQRFDSSNTRIISRATAAFDPSGPTPVLVLAASILFGLGLGAALAWLVEQAWFARKKAPLR